MNLRLVTLLLCVGVASVTSQILDVLGNSVIGPPDPRRVAASFVFGYAMGKAFPPEENEETPVCPEGWHLHSNNRCYFYSNNRKRWIGARKACRKIGGHLVTLKSADENTFVTGKAAEDYASKTTKDDYWIGCHRLLDATETVWDFDFKKVEFNDFSLTVANVADNRCCYMGNGIGFKWSHAECEDYNYYICERDWDEEFEYRC